MQLADGRGSSESTPGRFTPTAVTMIVPGGPVGAAAGIALRGVGGVGRRGGGSAPSTTVMLRRRASSRAAE